MQPLHIDCDTCSVRGPACGDCVVTVLLGLPGRRSVPTESWRQPRPVMVRAQAPQVELEGELLGGGPLPADLDDEERRALSVLAEAGLVPNLRVRPMSSVRRAG